MLSPELLGANGYSAEGTPIEQYESEPGCQYAGERMMLSLYKNQEKTVASYGSGKSWAEYTEIDVNGRAGARALSRSTQADGGACTTILSAGGGVLVLDGLSNDPRAPFDACGELLEIAQQIEPSLPE